MQQASPLFLIISEITMIVSMERNFLMNDDAVTDAFA
jgi:hypothetical protein